MNCPLCLHNKSDLFDQDKTRTFYQCVSCTLVFVPRNLLLTPLDEKKRYEFHENSENDVGYENYLRSIAKTITPFLKKNSSGLDFGCGRTKILANILIDENFQMDACDLYFFPDEAVWSRKYDFIILSEVIEHLAEPRELMIKLSKLLNPGGQIFIKTKVYPEDKAVFHEWFYKRDMTHVQFLNEKSFSELSQIIGLTGAINLGNDLYQFKK